jgi:hypothetical protein
MRRPSRGNAEAALLWIRRPHGLAGFETASLLSYDFTMSLHLVKLCVGAVSVEDLQAWIEQHLAEKRRRGRVAEHVHTTRMVPKRVEALLDGGSLYWVIKGNIQVRQKLVDIRPYADAHGIRRCDLVLDPYPVLTSWQPRRAFQGWRYLEHKDVPLDLGNEDGARKLPPHLRVELAQLGLL